MGCDREFYLPIHHREVSISIAGGPINYSGLFAPIRTVSLSTPSNPPNTVNLSILSVTFSSASNSFKRIRVGCSSINFAVLSRDLVAAVSSRRLITLAWAAFSASTTWFKIDFISPGKMMSFTPTLVIFRPYSPTWFFM